MKNDILLHLNEPRTLEQLYRTNRAVFRQNFRVLYPEIQGTAIADVWNERLNYENEEINWGTKKELVFIVIASLIAGLIAKIPAMFSLNEEQFYPKNIGFIVLPALTAYFAWKNRLSRGKMLVMAVATIYGLVFINSLPAVDTGDTIILSCMHLLVYLAAVLGFAYVGEAGNNAEKRLALLKYLGDLVVVTGLIAIAGGILSAVTIGLFELIGIDIAEFYFQNIVVFGLPAAPIFGTFLIQANPQLVGKISPVIAKIFSPLVLLMLLVYLGFILYSGKNPYTDREFLLIFNLLLIGVMALIFFSVAGSSEATTHRGEILVLLLLSVITIVVNGIALSAILFRISEWGFTANRTVVLGGNLLILVNLVLVTTRLSRIVSGRGNIRSVGGVIAAYLPVYIIWAAIVTFVFPFVFGFR